MGDIQSGFLLCTAELQEAFSYGLWNFIELWWKTKTRPLTSFRFEKRNWKQCLISPFKKVALAIFTSYRVANLIYRFSFYLSKNQDHSKKVGQEQAIRIFNTQDERTSLCLYIIPKVLVYVVNNFRLCYIIGYTTFTVPVCQANLLA